MDENIVKGDYVIVNVRGRSRVVQYIDRVDEVDGNDMGQKFLECITHHEIVTFIVNENNCTFVAEDIVFKQSLANMIGGTFRRANQLQLNCAFTKWNLSY